MEAQEIYLRLAPSNNNAQARLHGEGAEVAVAQVEAPGTYLKLLVARNKENAPVRLHDKGAEAAGEEALDTFKPVLEA